jgi:hypothetical protein
VRARRDINQIANYALLEWPDNSKISDDAPESYFPRLFERHRGDGGADERSMRFWHALPEGWEQMEYSQFLAARRERIAEVIRAGFEVLQTKEIAPPKMAGSSTVGVAAADDGLAPPTQAVLEQLPVGVREVFQELLDEPLVSLESAEQEIASHIERLEELSVTEEFLDVDTARVVADRCLRLLRGLGPTAPEEHRRLAHAAAQYFVLHEDAEGDFTSIVGFDDDKTVVAAVDRVLTSAATLPT